MELDPVQTRAKLLMLEHVTTTLWANFLKFVGEDTPADCARIADQSIAAIETIYQRSDGQMSDETHILVQHIIHQTEDFWFQVRQQVSRR